jgi:hypothetical protein
MVVTLKIEISGFFLLMLVFGPKVLCITSTLSATELTVGSNISVFFNAV